MRYCSIFSLFASQACHFYHSVRGATVDEEIETMKNRGKEQPEVEFFLSLWSDLSEFSQPWISRPQKNGFSRRPERFLIHWARIPKVSQTLTKKSQINSSSGKHHSLHGLFRLFIYSTETKFANDCLFRRKKKISFVILCNKMYLKKVLYVFLVFFLATSTKKTCGQAPKYVCM